MAIIGDIISTLFSIVAALLSIVMIIIVFCFATVLLFFFWTLIFAMAYGITHPGQAIPSNTGFILFISVLSSIGLVYHSITQRRNEEDIMKISNVEVNVTNDTDKKVKIKKR